MENIEEILKDFNSLLLDLIQNVADVCPNSVVGIHQKPIVREITRPDNKVKFVELFVARILQYKNQIDSGNDDFFLRKSYDSDVEQDFMQQVFEFKSIWHEFKRENKDLVIQYMQLLCELAQKYFIIVYG